LFTFISCPSFIVVEGDTPHIQPGTESTVHIQFNPKYEGLFEATIELVFYDNQRLAQFVVSRELHAIAGSVADHKHFESLDQKMNPQCPGRGRQVPPRKVILLSPLGRGRKSRRFPEYELPPTVQSAVDNATTENPYDKQASDYLKSLKPNSLDMETYAQWFNALLNVEDGHQQYAQLFFSLALTVMFG
jgi:hypothetical protein